MSYDERTEPDEDSALEGAFSETEERADSFKIKCDASIVPIDGPDKLSSYSAEIPSLMRFLDTPDNLKRSSTHRNYQAQSHAVLTADERLQAIILKENQRDEAARLKKEKAKKRAMQKIKLEEEKIVKRELKLKRKAEKEAEMQKKAEEKKIKAELKQLTAEKKTTKMRKPSIKI